jgi:hypothetical protein
MRMGMKVSCPWPLTYSTAISNWLRGQMVRRDWAADRRHDRRLWSTNNS